MSSEDRSERDPLQSLLAEILDTENRGETVDRDSLLAEHPQHADSLREFFASHDQMKSAANMDPPMLRPRTGQAREDPTIAPASPLDNPTLPPAGGDDATLLPSEGTSQYGEPTVGDKVRYFGDYELLEEIARGGMGVVYKARQVNLNRIVALKMILAGQFAGEEDVQRFYTEAEAAAQLDHPGIVPIFEIGEHAGQHYFSMAFIEGKSLAQRVADGPLPSREAAELTKKTTEAMAYAHSRGVIHRDLKPANVLLDRNGEPKVTDFGLAKKVEGDSNLTASGQILGTPAYMPPEQAAGKVDEVNDSADVYSLGGILYALLTGHPPFQADNHLDTLMQVLEKEPLAPSQLVPAIPRDLETICLKCLQKEPHRRYVAAEALSQDLQRYLNGEPIVARPISRVERAWRWCQRKPVAAGLIATAVLLLLTLGIGGPYIAVQQAEFAQRQEELRGVADEARFEAETKRKEADDAKSVAVAARQHEAQQRQKAEEATRKAELAQANETEARKVAEAERDAKGIALTRAEGLALCAQSNAVRETHPSLALLLAIESVQRTPTRVTFANLYAAHEACREVRTLVGHSGDVQDATFSHDGRFIATASANGGLRSLRLWDAASGKLIRGWNNLQPFVSSVALSPDGKRVAATTQGAVEFKEESPTDKIANLFQRFVGGTNDNDEKNLLYTDRICRVWDTAAGTELFRLATHDDRVTTTTFTADGKHIVTSSWDQTVRLWDADTGKEMKVWEGSFDGRPLASVSCSNDGQFIMAIPENNPKRSDYPLDKVDGDDRIDPDAPLVQGGIVANYFHMSDLAVPEVDRPAIAYLISVEEDKVEPLRSTNSELRPLSCALSSDGQQIAVAFQQGFAETWNRADLEQPLSRLTGHQGPVNTIAFSHDGKTVATGGHDRTVRIWDATTGEQRASLRGHASWVRSVEYGPGDRLVSSSDQTARIWDLRTVEPLARQLSGHKARVSSVQFDPTGDRIATASEDGTVIVWDARSTEALFVVDRLNDYAKPAFARYSPDGKQMMVAYNTPNPIRIFDAETGEKQRELKDDRGALSAFFTFDGKRLLTVSDEHVRSLTESVNDGASSVRFTDWMDYVKHPGHVSIWDPHTGKKLLTIDHPAPAKFIPIASPDSRWAIASTRDKWMTANVYDIDSGQQVLDLTGHRGRILDIAFNPQGDQILTGSKDDTACVWNSESGERIARLQAFDGDVTLCEWSSNGSRMVTVAESIAYVWDAKTLDLIATLKGHESPITKARFTPDGSHLFTLSEDQTAAFWEIKSSRMLILFQAAIDDEVIDADINSTGTLVVTGSSDGSVRLWPVDIWPMIKGRLPRQLTPEERRRYDLVTWQERTLKQSQSTPQARREQP